VAYSGLLVLGALSRRSLVGVSYSSLPPYPLPPTPSTCFAFILFSLFTAFLSWFSTLPFIILVAPAEDGWGAMSREWEVKP
jgi:hypothetical protein